ncbi:MAG: DUF4838 domain-containing protein [Chthoniobacterales bacterium]
MKILALVSATMLIVSSFTASALTLVEKGAPRATIVVAKTALTPAKEDAEAQKIHIAAQDLQAYIKKISGAELPIVGDDAKTSGTLVLVGPSQLTTAMKAAIPSGLTPERHEEGFLLQAKGNRLVLAGNNAGPYHGTEYAVYEFLNRLGVRWYMPSDIGEIIPKLPTITVADVSVTEKPDFIQRNWWGNTSAEMAVTERVWKIRNKMNPDYMYALPTDGSVSKYTADPAMAKDHPELFAKSFDGTINTLMPNLSNPETVKIAADKVIAYFQKNPTANSVGMAPSDGLPRDFNPATVKLNQGFSELAGREGVDAEMSGTEEWIEWVNAVTREVNKVFPDHIITTNGYANRTTPPFGVKIDKNVSIMFAAIWSDTLHAYDNPRSWQMIRQGELLQAWTKACDKVWIYAYDYEMIVSALTPVPGVRKLVRDYPLLKKWGVIGFINECRNTWMERGIATRYLNARLMWNANLDAKTLVDDFYKDWYGASAKPIQAFWDDLDVTMENTPMLGHEDRIMPFVYTPELIARLETDIADAEKLATTPTEKLHVQIDRYILEHLKLYMAMSTADLTGNYAEAAKLGNAMIEVRKKLEAVSSFFVVSAEKLPDGNINYASGIFGGWGIMDRVPYYQSLADKMNGKTGTLVTLLPQDANFTLDLQDDGRFQGWYLSDWKFKTDKTVTTAKPFYVQDPTYLDKNSYPFFGLMWYQFKVQVPASAKDQNVRLLIPIIEAEAWVWVNGEYVGHRPYKETYERPNDFDVDVTKALKPGAENVISIRVTTSMNRTAGASGLLARLFLYTPKAGSATAPGAAKPADGTAPLM